ncbi:hypothetical protein RI129_003665 [Pyrocoelia pectoralis]|uniref:DDE Tnp4 domain-containing protein n=1 Tax=Pyrocoelia pectoralis TaxID=417401 RepID=A0AAN7ZVB7_9COLE
MQVLAWTFHVGLTTVHKIVHETCQAIWDTLSSTYLKSPSTKEEWLRVASGFNQRWNFPHCVGALDGKHINIQAPAKSGSLYFNHKKRFSIVLLAACDSNYRFTLVDIGAFGSQSDGGILRNSIFGQRLEEGNMEIPEACNLPNSDVKMPYFLLADEAFPLKPYIMRPYPGKNLTRCQRTFNYRLSRARQIIENTFGLLVARWRILKTTITAKVENVDNIIKAIVVLHNYCQTEFSAQDDNMYCPPGYVDSGEKENGFWREEETPLRSVGRIGANIARRDTRDILADYFMSENGRVLWQDEMINRGRVFT